LRTIWSSNGTWAGPRPGEAIGVVEEGNNSCEWCAASCLTSLMAKRIWKTLGETKIVWSWVRRVGGGVDVDSRITLGVGKGKCINRMGDVGG